MADLTSSKIYGNLDVTRDVNILNNLALDGYLSKNVKINLNSQNDFSTVFSSPHLKLTSDNYVNTTGTTSIALSTSILDNYGVSLMGLRYGATGAPNFVLKIHNNSVSGIEAIRVIENGDVGINLTNPTVRLDVIDDSVSEGFRVRHSNLTQGISIGYNTITANGTNPNQNISINCKGTGTLSVNTDINIPTGKLYKINGVALNVVAGNGLTGGGNLGPTSTVTLGTPSSSTISSTNVVTTTSHTHALDLSGRTLTAGNGLTGGGTLAADRTFTLGTPSSITSSSTNSVTTTSHTHAITGFSLDSHTHTSFSNLSITGALSFGNTTRQMVNYYDTVYGRGVQTHTLYDRSYKNFAWYKGGVHSNTKYDPGTGGSVLMTLDESCKLGIGTGNSIPSACLHVRHTGSAQSTYNAIQLDNPAATNNGNQVGILFFWNTVNAARIAAVSQSSPSWASGLVFEVQNGTPYTLSEAMRINGAGNVGINNNVPNEKLDVAGNVKIREENSVKFAGTGASDSKYEICYNATDNSLCFNYIG